MAEEMRPAERGPYSAKPKQRHDYPTSRVALLPEHARDWVYARAQYEAGIKSAKCIADEIGVSTTSFFARSSNEGWTKNPEARTQHLTELKVAQELADNERLLIERDKAERVNAEMQARILVEHRRDVRRARTLTQRLFDELEALMDQEENLDDLGFLLRNENEQGKDRLNDMYRKIIDLPSRADINLKLSSALKNQILLERQAFGIVGALEDPERPVDTAPGQSDIDKILGKFDLVMKRKSDSTSSSQILGEIVDVSPGN